MLGLPLKLLRKVKLYLESQLQLNSTEITQRRVRNFKLSRLIINPIFSLS